MNFLDKIFSYKNLHCKLTTKPSIHWRYISLLTQIIFIHNQWFYVYKKTILNRMLIEYEIKWKQKSTIILISIIKWLRNNNNNLTNKSYYLAFEWVNFAESLYRQQQQQQQQVKLKVLLNEWNWFRPPHNV